jgi:hypothetical protein
LINQNSGRRYPLLYLCFLEYDVFASDRIELFELELSGLRSRVFFRDVKEAGVSAADQLYQNGIRLGHWEELSWVQGRRGSENSEPPAPVKAGTAGAIAAARGAEASFGVAEMACVA